MRNNRNIMSPPTTVLSRLPDLHRFFWAISLICFGMLSACSDKAETEMQAYHAQMHGITIRNTVLSEEFLAIAGLIQGSNTDSDKVAQAWQDRIIPLANELRSEVSDIQPDLTELREIHSQIVSCWSDRADAYTSMLATYRAGDSDGFKKAMESNNVSKAQEVSYFASINVLLKRYNLHLSQHP